MISYLNIDIRIDSRYSKLHISEFNLGQNIQGQNIKQSKYPQTKISNFKNVVIPFYK